jgi:hypothetical protein
MGCAAVAANVGSSEITGAVIVVVVELERATPPRVAPNSGGADLARAAQPCELNRPYFAEAPRLKKERLLTRHPPGDKN